MTSLLKKHHVLGENRKHHVYIDTDRLDEMLKDMNAYEQIAGSGFQVRRGQLFSDQEIKDALTGRLAAVNGINFRAVDPVRLKEIKKDNCRELNELFEVSGMTESDFGAAVCPDSPFSKRSWQVIVSTMLHGKRDIPADLLVAARRIAGDVLRIKYMELAPLAGASGIVLPAEKDILTQADLDDAKNRIADHGAKRLERIINDWGVQLITVADYSGISKNTLNKMLSGKEIIPDKVYFAVEKAGRERILKHIRSLAGSHCISSRVFYRSLGITGTGDTSLENMGPQEMKALWDKARDTRNRLQGHRFRRLYMTSGLKFMDFASRLRPDNPVDPGQLSRMLHGKSPVPEELMKAAEKLAKTSK